jgi:hypothetical protein
MEFNWESNYVIEYDTTCYYIRFKDYYIRVDSYDDGQRTYLIIYDFKTNTIEYKNDHFSSCEVAKKWAEKWIKLNLLTS